MRTTLALFFVVSLVYLPWWVVVPLGIVLSALPGGGVVAVVGGAVLDVVHGAPSAFFGTAYLYTALFSLSAVVLALVRERLLD